MEFGTSEEERLLARCRAGDLDAFGEVYARHQAVVLRHAFHMLGGHHDDASDVMQETFLRAYQALAGFRGECRLSTWLLRICGNLCRDRLRSWQRRSEVLCGDWSQAPEVLERGDLPDPFLFVEREHTTRIVLLALQGLTPAQRQLLLLREIEEMDLGEIAQTLRCSRGSAAVRLFRARQRLKEKLMPLLAARE